MTNPLIKVEINLEIIEETKSGKGRGRGKYDKIPTKKKNTRPGGTPDKDNDSCNLCQEFGHYEETVNKRKRI